MRKVAFFEKLWNADWPDVEWLKPYFIPPPGKQWSLSGGNDSGSFSIEGADGTEHFKPGQGQINIYLEMWRNPDLGILLIYKKWGRDLDITYTCRGDLTRLRQWVRSKHQTPLPIGLFIPFEKAWSAVREFIETEGSLPKSIEWIANRDLPAETFPLPHELKD